MSKITTHVLDAALGKPAARIEIRLEILEGQTWRSIAHDITDEDGRSSKLAHEAQKGTYRLVFETRGYMERNGRKSIYPEIVVSFVCDGLTNYHLPLLLSDNSYTTYRGS